MTINTSNDVTPTTTNAEATTQCGSQRAMFYCSFKTIICWNIYLATYGRKRVLYSNATVLGLCLSYLCVSIKHRSILEENRVL